jgi:serine/threonine protein kinase
MYICVFSLATRGLVYLHGMRPQIVHRSLSCENIYINGGQGGLCIGNTWLAAILSVDAEPIIMSETMAKHSQMIASPACKCLSSRS